MPINSIVWVSLIIATYYLWVKKISHKVKLQKIDQLIILSVSIFLFFLFSKLAWIHESYVIDNINKDLSIRLIFNSGQRSYGGFLLLSFLPQLVSFLYKKTRCFYIF